MQHPPSPPHPHRDPYYPDPDAHRFLTIDEAVVIYRRLEAQVRDKLKEARDKNLPFKLVVLEKHGSKNAFAYEMMLLDIAKNAGISTLALEQSSEQKADALSKPIDWKYSYLAPTQYLMQSAQKKRVALVAMDNKYASIAEENAVWGRKTEELAQPKIRQFLAAPSLVLTLTADPDPASAKYTYQLANVNAPDQATSRQVAGMIAQARAEAFDFIRTQRNQYMVNVIKAQGDVMVITGKKHGEGIIPALRESAAAELVYSVYGASDKAEDQAYLASNIPKIDKDRLEWAIDPKNVVLLEGKDFPQENLPIFIERVIEKANQKTIGGPA